MRSFFAVTALACAALVAAGCGSSSTGTTPETVEVVGSYLGDMYTTGASADLIGNLGLVVRSDRSVSGACFTSAPAVEADVFFTGTVDSSNRITATGRVIGSSGTVDIGEITFTGKYGTYSDGATVEGTLVAPALFPAQNLTCTVVATTNVITTATDHGLTKDTAVVFDTTAGGITAGTVYYVLTVPTATTFTVSTAVDGSTLNITSDGTNAYSVAHAWRAYTYPTTVWPLGCYMGTYAGGRSGAIAIMNFATDDTVVMTSENTSVLVDYFAAQNILSAPTQTGGDYGLLADDSWYGTGTVINGSVGTTAASGNWTQAALSGTWQASRPATSAARSKAFAGRPQRIHRVRSR